MMCNKENTLEELELISIIIPVYNAEKYIENCLKSLIAQTYKNLEIIFVDDKSTDNSLHIIGKYLYDKRINIIKKDVNSGVSNTRNIGIEISKGCYIMFVDADDYIAPTCIEEMYKLLKGNNADVVCSNFKIVDNSDEELTEESLENNIILFQTDEIESIICSMLNNRRYKIDPCIWGFSWGKLYRRSIIEDITFDEKVRFREDTLFNIQIYQRAKKILYCNTPYYFYYVNEKAASFRFFEDYEREISYFFTIINKYYPIIENECLNICGLFMYMTYLKHYAMHKNLTFGSRYKLIRDTFNNEMWRAFFKNVNYSQITLPYKILVFFFRYKISYGIILLFEINAKVRKR